MNKFNSHATRGDLTPRELDEIWARVQAQLTHDAATDSLKTKPGAEHYIVRQMAFYINQVKRERLRLKR